MNEEKRQALTQLLDDINRSGGKKLVDKDRRAIFGSELDNIETIPTGFLEYDRIIGGEPRGRITIDYGIESTGKTTWNYTKIASFQRKGLVCAVVDAEASFDPVWCAQQGVEIDDLIVIPPKDYFEDTVNDVGKLIDSGHIDFFLVDSIHGSSMFGELYKRTGAQLKERNIEDDEQALAPRKIGKFIRKVTPLLGKHKAMMTIIGQARENIGAYGGGVSLSGGHQLKHHSACTRLWTRTSKDRWPKRGQDIIGFSSRVKVIKTKINENENAIIEIPFILGEGPSVVQANVDTLLSCGIIKAAGAWFEWVIDGEKEKANGKQKLYEYFEQNEDKYTKIINKLYEETKHAPGNNEDNRD